MATTQHPTVDRISKICREQGCKATTIRGYKNWIKKHGLKTQPQKYKPRKKFTCIPIEDSKLSRRTMKSARDSRPRVKNWDYPSPTIKPSGILVHDHGRYSSKCWYTKHTYEPTYVSYLKVAKSGEILFLIQENYKRRIFAPSGLKFGIDEYGVYVISKDGTEYHPTIDDFKSSCFAKTVREHLSDARRKRANAQKEEKEFNRLVRNCYVTIQDARRAGNCMNGIIGYMTRIGYTKRFIVSPYAKVLAKQLKMNDVRVKRSINKAIERETMISI